MKISGGLWKWMVEAVCVACVGVGAMGVINGVVYAEEESAEEVDDTDGEKTPNFKNTIAIELNNEIVYTGETATGATAVATTRPFAEGALTQVKGAVARVIVYARDADDERDEIGIIDDVAELCGGILEYMEGGCATGYEWEGDLNTPEETAEEVATTMLASGAGVNIFDVTAGSYYCMVAAIYPATSESDESEAVSGGEEAFRGDDKWYVSAPKCRKVARRAFFNVSGGSLYAAGAVFAPASIKRSVGNEYHADRDETEVFASWVSQAVVANGLASGIASGASTGFDGSKEGRSLSYCNYRAPLSLANYGESIASLICPYNDAVGRAELDTGVVDGEILMDNLGAELTEGDAEITGAYVGAGEKYVVRVTGDVRINGNIEYSNATVTNFSSVPRAVLYAGGDIIIACGVERVDAILIARGAVRTCGDYDSTGEVADEEVTERSTPLRIHGVVIAGRLVLGRVYAGDSSDVGVGVGAGVGADSGVVAETIDYDSSAVEFSSTSNDVVRASNLVETYVRELAPRY